MIFSLEAVRSAAYFATNSGFKSWMALDRGDWCYYIYPLESPQDGWLSHMPPKKQDIRPATARNNFLDFSKLLGVETL